jgi:hypothetical protein
MESRKEELFVEQIDLGTAAYKNIASTYREMQSLLNELYTGARTQMEIISEVEEGFGKDGEETINKLNEKLCALLGKFNEDIDENITLFESCIDDSMRYYLKSLAYFEGENSEVEELKKVIKTLQFLEVLMAKITNRIKGVATNLKVLPTLTKEIKSHKKTFDKEAKILLIALRSGENKCRDTQKKILAAIV